MIPHGLISRANQEERCENVLQSANNLTSASKLGQRDGGGELLVLVWKVLALMLQALACSKNMDWTLKIGLLDWTGFLVCVCVTARLEGAATSNYSCLALITFFTGTKEPFLNSLLAPSRRHTSQEPGVVGAGLLTRPVLVGLLLFPLGQQTAQFVLAA